MAISTAELRRSAGGASFGYVGLLPGVTPNASKDQEWRQQAGWSYSGILAGTVIAEDLPASVNYSQAKSSAIAFPNMQSEKLRISLAKTPLIDLSDAGYQN